MAHSFPELPGWSFDAEEVSAGIYRAFGRDQSSRNVDASGSVPETLIEKGRQTALQIMGQQERTPMIFREDKCDWKE